MQWMLLCIWGEVRLFQCVICDVTSFSLCCIRAVSLFVQSAFISTVWLGRCAPPRSRAGAAAVRAKPWDGLHDIPGRERVSFSHVLLY